MRVPPELSELPSGPSIRLDVDPLLFWTALYSRHLAKSYIIPASFIYDFPPKHAFAARPQRCRELSSSRLDTLANCSVSRREVLLGITGKDFVIIAASKAAVRGPTILKATDDKTRQLNDHTLMAYSGEPGDGGENLWIR